MTSRPLLLQLLLGIALGLAVLCVISRYILPPFQISAASDVESPPLASIEPPYKDFGVVARGSALAAQFRIFNKGNQRLLLRRVDAACGCLAGQPEMLVVDPGGCQTVSLEFASADRVGPQRYEATYRTNDPRQPFLTLVGTAEVK